MSNDSNVRNDPNPNASPTSGDRDPAAAEEREARLRRDETAEDFGAVGARTTRADLPDEVGILRDELQRNREEIAELRAQMEEVRAEAGEARDKYLRARADLENVRRRSAQDVERARESGLDSAVLNVLSVYDDLSRALQVADDDDPAKILPGVRAVRDALERNLGTLDIERVGAVGETFDPDLHEALTSVPAPDAEAAGTIADVYQAGFTRGDRLVRPARVVVYAEQE